MGKDEVFNSTAGGISLLGLYMKATADKYGLDKAIELYGKVGKSFGDTTAWKNKFGDKTPSAEELKDVVLAGYDVFGFDIDIKAGKGLVTNKLYKCPFYTGFSMAGFSHDEIHKLCTAAFTAKVKEIERAYPKIKVQEEPRKTPDGYCTETYRIK
jgi:hypothetical protein